MATRKAAGLAAAIKAAAAAPVFTPRAELEAMAERPVIICTVHKGVFFGYAADTSGDVIDLKRARMAIYWGTTRGVMELAEVGPNTRSKISARADIQVRCITAVFEVSPAAVAKWEAAV